METILISDSESVVRIILHQESNGAISPKAFKLRQWPEPKGPERYISVNRFLSESIVTDLRAFDKGRDLACALMNVGEIRHIKLFLGEEDKNPVVYDVRDMHSDTNLSHAGIFISIDGKPFEGSGEELLTSIEGGGDKEISILAIRRKLVDIASKNLTTVETICGLKAQSVV